MPSSVHAAQASIPFVVLIGNPNTGKSTLFNALTGLNQTTGNYPGVTVERKQGRLKLSGGGFARILDLPGTYSLLSKSPDEEIVRATLAGKTETDGRPDLGVVVLDASNFERNLYLALQLMDVGLPIVIALNMWDAAGERGGRLDPYKLSSELGVPCIPTVGHRREGVAELVRAIERELERQKKSGSSKAKAAPQVDEAKLTAALRAVAPEERYGQIELLARRVTPVDSAERVTVSDRIDAVVTHPFGAGYFLRP